MKIVPISLSGTHVRLEPLSLDHLDQLCEIGINEELWKATMTRIRSRDDLAVYVRAAIEEEQKGISLPFAIIVKEGEKAVGSTRYSNIDHQNRHLEIGWTWIAKSWQRTAVNTESKLLLLRHAFEVLGCIRVEFKTDSVNEQSRNALLRIGAKEEGIFRNHMITPSGRIRHSVYYSIIDSEWSEVSRALEKKLSRNKVSL